MTFHMIKSKFGQRLRSKTLAAQINEAPCKLLNETILKIFFICVLPHRRSL